MHFSIPSVLCLVLIVSTACTANVVPKEASKIMQFPKTIESQLGTYCQYGDVQGICTKMEECPQTLPKRKSKAENDPCLNERQNVVVCCTNATAPKRTRLDSSSEEAGVTESV
uniref:Clip domain-containing protein n=1 Tax=Anopheles epiroticus TaxID=199890 RepID=A0A182PAJ7_9DIPT